MFKRPLYQTLRERIAEPRRYIQALMGPRQTGKTTLAQQILAELEIPTHYATADEPVLKDFTWIEQQWEIARTKLSTGKDHIKGLLVLDEVQKITGWSETVKRLWDEDSSRDLELHVIVLGSSLLLVQQGLTESLAGRFEIIPVTHWSFVEMQEAFGWDVERYMFYGGYPGAAELVHDHQRWRHYIIDSLIETTVSRDIFLMTRVDKPALLRRLFELGCTYSGQVLSYQKMLGQLLDAGNTTTLAHYLNLLEGAGLLAGLSKYAGQRVRRRASSPKLQVLNTGLMTALSNLTFEEARQDTEYWGRLVETAVGAALYSGLQRIDADLYYWSSLNKEVDFVLAKGKDLVAIEVKSGRRKTGLPGIEAFSKEFKVKRKLLLGPQGLPLDQFFSTPSESLLRK
jgi:predicted AAA+ superfamily ATPase